MIYFAQRTDLPSRPIKIGTSERIKARIKSLVAEESIQLGALIVLGISEGGHKEEKHLHYRFSHLRIDPNREWFIPGNDLLTFIKSNTFAWDGTNGGNEVRQIAVNHNVAFFAKVVAAAERKKVTELVNEILGEELIRRLEKQNFKHDPLRKWYTKAFNLIGQ